MDDQERAILEGIEVAARKLRKWRERALFQSLTGTYRTAEGEIALTAHEDGRVVALIDEQTFDLTPALRE